MPLLTNAFELNEEIYHPIGNGYCVGFVQAAGYAEYRGDAWKWLRYINSYTPQIGDVVVFKKNHVAIVADVKFKVTIIEQNYEGWGIVSTRSLDMFDDSIAGYIHKDRP